MSPCARCFGTGRVARELAFGVFLAEQDGGLAEIPCPQCGGSGKIPERARVGARVYVAAPFTEWPLVRTVQAELRRRGATISEDWTAGIESLPPGLTDADVSEEVALQAAQADLQGVTDADACIFLTVDDKTKGKGMWIEYGYALALRDVRVARNLASVAPRLAVCGPHRDSTIFSRLGKRFPDWKDALPYVLGETP